MTDNRVPLRESKILDDFFAVRHARISHIRKHAARIDPGIRLAREICDREKAEQLGDALTPIIVAIPDRTMPAVKQTFPPPTGEAVLDDFDFWAGAR